MTERTTVYLDYAATSPLDDRVVEAMQPYGSEIFGNPSSMHGPGRRARHAVEENRERIASILGVLPAEIIFTGSGTEADNMALLSKQESGHRLRLITSKAEHEAVVNTSEYVEASGGNVLFLTPESDGSISEEAVTEALAGAPALVSVMHVNNETGALNPIQKIASQVHAAGGVIHTDAVQSAACYDVQALTAAVDMLTLSAHKIGGPKGIGLLFVRQGIASGRVVFGGSQERKRRAGTENVSGIAGFAEALALAQKSPVTTAKSVREKRDHLARQLISRLGDRVLVTTEMSEERSAPHILHCLFRDERGRGLDGEMLILGLDLEGLYVSSGAACSSGTQEPSHVLTAIGIDRHLLGSAVRFSLGNRTSMDDIDIVSDRTERVVNRITIAAR